MRIMPQAQPALPHSLVKIASLGDGVSRRRLDMSLGHLLFSLLQALYDQLGPHKSYTKRAPPTPKRGQTNNWASSHGHQWAGWRSQSYAGIRFVQRQTR